MGEAVQQKPEKRRKCSADQGSYTQYIFILPSPFHGLRSRATQGAYGMPYKDLSLVRGEAKGNWQIQRERERERRRMC